MSQTISNFRSLLNEGRDSPPIPIDSPVVTFIERIPASLLDPKGKIRALRELPLDIWRQDLGKQIDWLVSKAGVTLPHSIPELTSFLKDYHRVLDDEQLTYVFIQVLKEDLAKDTPTEPFSSESLELIQEAVYKCVSTYTREGIEHTAKSTLRKFMFRESLLSLDSLSESTRNIGFDNLTYLYNHFARLDLFPSLAARETFEELLTDRIKAQPTLNGQAGFAYRLLKSSGSDPEAICSFKTKRFCEELVTTRIASLLGKDDGSSHFMRKIKHITFVLRFWGIHNSRRAILTELAERCELQREAAKFVKSELGARNNLSYQLQHLGVKGFEPFLKAVGRDPVSRVVFIDFLSQPLSPPLLSQIVHDITKAKEGTRLTKFASSHEFYEFRKALNSRGVNSDENDLTPEQEGVRLYYALSQIHSHYQQLALDQRALVLDQLLSPASAVMEDSLATTRRAISLCLNRLFPASVALPDKSTNEDAWEVLFLDGITKPITRIIGSTFPTDIWRTGGGYGRTQLAESPVIRRTMAVVSMVGRPDYSPKEERRQKLARVFIETYLEASSELERPLLVAAFMAAAEQSQGTQSFGERLACLLEILGPAYIKLGQAGHSLPSTPEDIKEPLGRLKGRALPLKRWEVIERIDAATPPEILSRIKRIGPTRGSASFNVSTQIQFEVDGATDSAVISLLREQAKADALRGYTKLERCAEKLAESDPAFKKISPLLIKLIERARSLTLIETDPATGANQELHARKQYDDVRVTVGETLYKFCTAKWLTHFAEGRISKEVLGPHFNELEADSPSGALEKKKVAKAYLLTEFRNLLSGDRFDCDRHGYQLRVDGEQIGLFDHGGLALSSPTVSDKRKLAKVLTKVRELGSFSHFNDELQVAIESEQSGDSDSSNYLTHVQRGVLALSDFLEQLEPKDYRDIFEGLATNGDIDPIFRQALGISRLILLQSGFKRDKKSYNLSS